MQTVEIWPDKVEGGDAVGDAGAFAYLLFTDTASNVEVAVMLQPEAEQAMLEQLDAWLRSRLAGRDKAH